MMSRADRRACTYAAMLLSLVPMAAVFAASAKADPVSDYTVANASVVCIVLDRYPTDEGLIGVINGIEEDGFSQAAAAKIVVNAVAVWCPRNQTVINHFIRGYNPMGAVGGNYRA